MTRFAATLLLAAAVVGSGPCGGSGITGPTSTPPANYQLNVTDVGTGTGIVAESPTGPTYQAGDVVTLTAVPGNTSTFGGWGGACAAYTAAQACVVTMNSDVTVTAQFNLCPNNWCGTVSSASITLYYTPVGFGYNWTGSVTLQFSSAPPPMTIVVYYFGFDITGSAATTGGTSLTIPVAGSTVACAIANGYSLVVENAANPNPVLANFPITWQSTGCP